MSSALILPVGIIPVALCELDGEVVCWLPSYQFMGRHSRQIWPVCAVLLRGEFNWANTDAPIRLRC
jgi:hypothetical protein